MTTTTVSKTLSSTEVSTDLLLHERLVQMRAIDRAEDRVAAIDAQLVERLGVGGKYESDEAKVAIVESHTQIIDVDALQAVASKHTFYKLTKRVVDMTAFKALSALGVVPAEVNEIVTVRVSKASARITVKR